jgi:hypothetical protein
VPAAIPDRSVAEAMEQVLTAEREAARAVAAAAAEADAAQRSAHQARLRILDRARRRATRLHEEMHRRLAISLAELERDRRPLVTPPGSLEGLVEEAARRVAQSLTSAGDDWS